jgi:hypothetical protein
LKRHAQDAYALARGLVSVSAFWSDENSSIGLKRWCETNGIKINDDAAAYLAVDVRKLVDQ